ncbi:MAG: hypothetical protein ACOYWZ_19230 [Bacillota bacterium]
MDGVFCTIVSKFRAFQAIALFISLKNVMPELLVYVLCIDDSTYNLLSKMNFNNINLIHINELADDMLEEIKTKRKLNEYCWTLKPVFIEKLFKEIPKIQRITYIDADLFFFSDPSIIFKSQEDSSVLLSRGEIIIPMLPLPLVNILQELMGNYNSGFISFKRDKSALDCIGWWKQSCLNSCISRPEAGKFGDQKYLDNMPGMFDSVKDISTPGVNIGHWNNSNHVFGFINDVLCVDEDILICYHFSGFRILKNGSILKIHEADRLYIPFFYEIYADVIVNIVNTVNSIYPDFDGYSTEEDLSAK